MVRVLLDNAAWDFGTNCFVCEPKNERGLGVPFYLDEEAKEVQADFTPATHHSSAPTFAHGGVSMALLDEGMAWAVIALAHRFGVTRRADVTFSRPVRVGQPHTVVCRIESHTDPDLVASGELRDARGRTCVAMRAEFHVMTKEQAAAALGTHSEAAQSYTRD